MLPSRLNVERVRRLPPLIDRSLLEGLCGGMLVPLAEAFVTNEGRHSEVREKYVKMCGPINKVIEDEWRLGREWLG